MSIGLRAQGVGLTTNCYDYFATKCTNAQKTNVAWVFEKTEKRTKNDFDPDPDSDPDLLELNRIFHAFPVVQLRERQAPLRFFSLQLF